MVDKRPIVLTIAGLDPSAGAGLLADIKTMEQHKVYGIAVCTAITLQTESEFIAIRWERELDIIQSVEKLLQEYAVSIVKIGIIEDYKVLLNILRTIKKIKSDIKVILDPVMRSSSGHIFWDPEAQEVSLLVLLAGVYLLTPNYEEMLSIYPELPPMESAKLLSQYCNILLKGGHNKENEGVDYLFANNEIHELKPTTALVYPKHGSGCVLSSSIASNLSLGYDLLASCKRSKHYIEKFLSDNQTLLGNHYV